MTLSKRKDLFVFFVGLMGYFKFRFLGTFYGNELMIFFSYFFINWRPFVNNSKVRLLIKFAILWLIGVVVSNLWNSIDTVDSLKGTFSVVFLILLVPFVYWMMIDKPSRWLYYAAGAAIAWAVSFYTGRGLEIANNSFDDLKIWQVYFFYPAIVAIAGILYYRGRHYLSYLIVVLFGLWSLSRASRNIFLSMSLAVAVLLYIESVTKRDAESNIKRFKKRIVGLLFACVIGFVFVDTTYERLASSGTLGERVYNKYMMQKYSSMGLLSARGDFFLSAEYIAQHPIFGYGSYCTLNNKKALEATENMHLTVEDRNDLVPGHSHILGAWVYSGLLGFLYWLFILIYLFRIFFSGILLSDPKLLGFRVYTLFVSLFNILFSPFQNRIDILLLVINLMIFEQSYKQRKISGQ